VNALTCHAHVKAHTHPCATSCCPDVLDVWVRSGQTSGGC